PMSFRRLGTSSARSRNEGWGVAQSSPMTATRGACGMSRLPDRSVVAKRSPAPFAAAPNGILPTSRTGRPSCENGPRHDAAEAGPVLGGRPYRGLGRGTGVVPVLDPPPGLRTEPHLRVLLDSNRRDRGL